MNHLRNSSFNYNGKCQFSDRCPYFFNLFFLNKILISFILKKKKKSKGPKLLVFEMKKAKTADLDQNDLKHKKLC